MSTETTVPTPGRMRASDADRQQTVQQIQDAAARGLLTPDEAGERMSAAYAHGADAARWLESRPGRSGLVVWTDGTTTTVQPLHP